MDSNSLVEGLKESLSNLQAIEVEYSSISSRNRVFELKGKLNGFIYVHIRTAPPYHWGITKNTVDKIKTQGKPWCVILLCESPNKGYVISSKDYDEGTQSNLWPNAQGDYKISSGKSLVGIPKFTTAEELLGILFKTSLRTP
jgi:hypothetical protein